MRWDDVPWRPWRPEEAFERLRGVDVPWCVAAGWALDLFVGRERRTHEDLEIAVPEHRFEPIAGALAELEWYTVGGEEVVPVTTDPERLRTTHQTWGLDARAGVWRIDVFREPCQDELWVCRRDGRIRLAYDELIQHSAGGIPYVRPEIALLFKAKAARAKDEQDLRDVLPLLDTARRALVVEWLELAHPGHAWLRLISGGA